MFWFLLFLYNFHFMIDYLFSLFLFKFAVFCLFGIALALPTRDSNDAELDLRMSGKEKELCEKQLEKAKQAFKNCIDNGN